MGFDCLLEHCNEHDAVSSLGASVLLRGGKMYVINTIDVCQVQGSTATEAEFSETSMCKQKQIKTRCHTKYDDQIYNDHYSN